MDGFRRRYQCVRTIGVSVFNKRQETSEHFGPLRVGLRLLYNLNTIEEPGAYVEVGRHRHHWCDEKLLIFDDTLMHKSCNGTDQMRYCLLVDMLRPSLLPSVMDVILTGVRLVARRFNFVFYKNWAFIT